MKTMIRKWSLALAVMAGVLAFALPADAKPSMPHDGMSSRLTRKGGAGHIDVRAGRKHFPKDAEVSLTRTHAENAKRKIKDGLKKHRRHNVLAMYDISIKSGGKKWQPDAGDPVRVTVDLDEPVAVTATSSLGVAHLSDDGEVEELPASRYGFTYNADRTTVTSFWFDATGFSIYTIIDTDGELQTPRRFYHFFGHPTTENGTSTTLPYLYRDQSNDVVNVQIVKDGDVLKEPPIPRDVLDEDGEVKSVFEGWYVVSSNARPATAVESKLDNTNEYFHFTWPVGATDMRMSFTNAVAVTETVDWDYYVVPLFEHARFLQFDENARGEAEEGAGERIIRRKLVAINDETGEATLKVSDVSAALKNSRNEYFCGWEYLDTDNQYKQLLVYSEAGKPQDQFIIVDDALFEANGGIVIPLYPYYVEAHFLHFNANAKSVDFVGSLFVRSTSNVKQVDVSGHRKGYDFGGWQAGFYNEETKELTLGEMVTDAQGNFIPNKSITNPLTGAVAFTTDAQGNIRMNEDVTLYGTWVANSSAPYRVIIWQQRATDSKDATDEQKKYYYATHYTSPAVSANTQVTDALFTNFSGTRADGTSVSGANLSTLSGEAGDNAANEDFTGFHYGRYESTDATVASDGSTVVNVYYDRNIITYDFKLFATTYTVTTANSNQQGTQYGTDDGGVTYYRIYYRSNQWRKTNSNNGTVYTGTRYIVSSSGWNTVETMTGLYGQTLEAAGYTWSQEHWWYANGSSTGGTSGTRTTFRDAFLPPDVTATQETFYGNDVDASATRTVSFYKQSLDGQSWILADAVKSESNGFSITDKYNGFTAYQFSNDGGNWQSVGTKGSNGHYSGSPNYSRTLDIRNTRNKYELIYKYIDNDGNGDEHTVYDTGKVVPYESPLTDYNYAYTNALLNWSECDIANRTFEGWYEDASLTKKFDFDATMPDGKKIIYARWAPKKHRVIIDPNGGELLPNEATWFYVDPSKDEVIEEYTPTRKYRLDLHNGTYYYHFDPWDPVKDKHTDQYDPATSNATRKAYYTTNIVEATTNEGSNPENRYTYDPGAYAFMGWFQVLENGALATDPFSFGEPPTGPVTLRAIWRRLGIYTLKYESIDPSGHQTTEIIYDPQRHASGNVEDGYVADGETTLAKVPTNYDKDEWLWEGWQVIDTYNNNIPLTTIRSPGDIYIVKPAHADLNNVIHFRAVYKHIGDSTSKHVPPVTDLILDSNDNAGLAAGAAVAAEAGRVGTYTDGSTANVSGLNQGVWFAGQQNNFSVNLAYYTSTFAHNNGYFLLGWDTNRVVSSLIPSHYANETIGIDKTSNDENVLYAVWEPQIYIEFVNDTGATLNNVKLYIPGWMEGEIFRVNSVQDTYRREAFSAFHDGEATFNMAAGERFCLVLPDAADKDFTVMGACTYTEGEKLVVTRIQPQIAGQAAIPDVTHSVYPGENYMVAGTMKVSPTPVQVRFTKDTYPTTTTVPVRYFLHDKSGTVTEITQYSATYWQSQNYQTSLTVGAATNDIATMLRTDNSNLGVHELLTDSVRTSYGHTTIGIGSASAVITSDHETLHANEYRSITQEGASGGPYFRFYHEELDWSRYAQIWNGYDDPAVYVVFYKRTPVHVTIGKNVVGSEEDKARTFDFTAQITEHSTNLEYTVTTTYRQTREISITAYSSPSSSDWDTAAAKVAWSDPTGTQTNISNATASSDQTPDLFESRSPEQISLVDAARHPITIYFDQSDDMIGTPTLTESTQYGSVSSSGLVRKTYTRTQTKTTTQTVTYRVTYQYEVATIQETASELYTLTGIDGGGDSCKGAVNLPARTYTISSLSAPDAKGFFTYQSLDTAIFTNTRKSGSLSISTTNMGGNPGDTFTFTVTLGETVVDKDNYTPPEGVHLGPYGKVFAFTIPAGETVTLTNLPAGASYTIAEGVHAEYVTTVPDNASGTIAAGETIEVNFVNTRKTDLVITMNERTVSFTGEEQSGYDISCVTGAVNNAAVVEEGYTVTGLKEGHVLVVEHHVPAHGSSVGEYTGHFENARYTILDADGNDVTDQYLVTPPVADKLTIEGTPIVVEVTGNTTTATYDGTEHVCQGYTYVVKNAVTGEVIENENILVSVDPQYQQAYQTNVGKTEMLLDGHVNVQVPDGFQLQGVTVVGKGYMEITPAQVMVTADSLDKMVGESDPTLTATVTGLIGNDQIDYTLTREAGEDMGAYTITASGETTQGNYTVTYVNGTFTVSGMPVDLHVAVTEDGTIVNGDKDFRSEDPADYTVELGISDPMTAGEIAATTNTLFKEEMDDGNHFVGVYYGTTNEQGQVTIGGEVTQIGLVKPEGGDSYIPCVNGDPTIPLSGYQVYVLYCELPKIYYVAAAANGALTKRDTVRLNGDPVAMGNAGEAEAAQGTVLSVGADAAFTVAEGSGTSDFRVPTTLDGTTQASLNFIAFGAGAEDLTSTNTMNGVTLGKSIQLKIVDLVLKWSVDGETWSTFTSKPAVYAIYKDGHDLTINATSLASADDKATDTFTVTISSENLVDGVPYAISGYTDSNGNPIETVTPVNGVITLRLKSDDSVTIQSLQNDGTNPYVVKQTPNAEDYDKTDITVNGSTPSTVSEDGSVSIVMDGDTVVDITNTKSYTVTFVDENGKTVTETKLPYGTSPADVTNGVVPPAKPMDETSIYKFTDWGPEVEPVGSNTTYTAEYKEIKIPAATQRTEDGTNLVVALTAEEAQAREEALTNALAAVGIDIFADDYSEEVATELLNSVDPNGLRHWENLVTGTDTNAPPLSTSSVSSDPTRLTVQIADDPGKQADLGYAMFRDLRKFDEENKTWHRVAGPEPAGNPAFNIPLVDAQGKSIGATGLYRVFTLLVPNTYQAITNEIPSTNIIGVLEVVSPLTNTVVAVPWKELASDPALAADITVSNYVSTVNLSDGDCVYALPDDTGSKRSGTDASGIYEMWTLEGGYWDAYTTVSFAKGGDSGYSEITPADPSDKRRFPRTKAVWVQRKRPLDDNGNPVPFFLIGQYEFKGVEIAIKGGSAADPGYTLISVPSYKDFSINSLDWSGYKPSDGDFIRVVNGTQSFLLKWSDGKWCTEEINYRRGRPSGVKYERYETPLKAGTGFWFCGHGADFTITWTPEEEVR